MKSTRTKQSEVVRLVPDLAIAINRWLAARGEYKKQANDESQNAYNATYYALGEVWAQQNPHSANIPGEFERFRSRLISPEENSASTSDRNLRPL